MSHFEKLIALYHFIESPQTVQQRTEFIEPQSIGSVGEGLLRGVMHFDEQAVDAHTGRRSG